MKLPIQGGSYDDDIHAYYDEAGQRIPSITQVLSLQGLSDYSGVDPDVLANAARRGTAVHELAAWHNRFGEVDPTWVTPELEPYFNGYLKFLSDTGFAVEPAWVEKPVIGTICGMRLGLTPDCYGKLGRYGAIIEFKCTAAPQPSWSIQTAAQELIVFNSSRCGRVKRFALMLLKDGGYRLIEHSNHEEDLQNLIAALRNVWWRIGAGQDVLAKVSS